MKLFAKILILLSMSAGLGCSAGGEPVPTATGLLYVLDRPNKAVFVFDNIATLDGALDPVRTLQGDNTQIESPAALAIDGRRDILYVADTSSEQVLAFIPGSQADQDISPRRVYPGLSRASAMFCDISNDRLYAADAINRAIQVWDGIGSLPTGSEPDRSIPLEYEPSAVFVDTRRDLLYVGDPASGSIKVYKDASTLGVLAPPDSEIQDAVNPFLDIRSITMNVDNDILFVADDFLPSVEMFNSASTLDGEVDPDRFLHGAASGLTFDIGQAVFVENVLYQQLNRTQVGIWDSANTLAGEVAPNRLITVNGATQIVGIAVDLAH